MVKARNFAQSTFKIEENKMQAPYLPIEERVVDTQYRDLLLRILVDGKTVKAQQGEEARMVLGHQMRFPIANGIPIITERNLYAKNEKSGLSILDMALGELFAFLAGEHTQDGLKRYNCPWWRRWVTKEKCAKRGLPEGDLGPGSYGPAWRSFPTSEGASCDQIVNVLQQLRELPHLRTHFISPWIPQYTYRGKGKQQRVVVVPCHGWLHFLVDTYTNEISLHHFQRSADVPVGLPANMIQYSALLLMMAQVLGYVPKELVYTLSDAHIFESQVADAIEMANTRPQKLPIVILDPSVTDLFAFRQEHFTIREYQPQLPSRRIWTPV